jgi:cytochrome c1
MNAARALMRISVLAAPLLAFGCGAQPPSSADADATNGRLLLRQYGCVSCHRIPGVAGASGNVGPPLDAIARRVYLAGMVPNTPAGMVQWIRAPQAIDPSTAMPDLRVPERHARDMTAYLYLLR